LTWQGLYQKPAPSASPPDRKLENGPRPGAAAAGGRVAAGHGRARDNPGGTRVDRDATTGGGVSQAASGRIGTRGRPDGADQPLRLRLAEHRIAGGEVIQERFVDPVAGLITRQAIGRVGWPSEAGRCGGEAHNPARC